MMTSNLFAFLNLIDKYAAERAEGEVSPQTRQEIADAFQSAVNDALNDSLRSAAGRRR